MLHFKIQRNRLSFIGFKRFSTSRQTLTCIPDTFFTALLSGRISTLRDEGGAIFIDRDPSLFSIILNYLRTREVDISKCDIRILRHEAEYYNISPLIQRLMLCEDLKYASSCGDILFYGYLVPPAIPVQNPPPSGAALDSNPAPKEVEETASSSSVESSGSQKNGTSILTSSARPGQMVRVPSTNSGSGGTTSSRHGHSRNSSWDLRVSYNPANGANRVWPSHSRTASLDLRHSRNSSADLNKFIRNDIAMALNNPQNSALIWSDPLRVQIIKAHHNWITVAYPHFFTCYRLKDSVGWQLVFTSPYIEANIERIALNAKVSISSGAAGQNANGDQTQNNMKMVAISYGSQIRLWGIDDGGLKTEIGTFALNVRVEYLFFIGSQLVALSSSGKIGVWHAMTTHWQTQDLVPILSFDTAGSFLLLGCNNGSIYYIGKKNF